MRTLALLSVFALAAPLFAQVSEPPAGYTWSANLPAPPALVLNPGENGRPRWTGSFAAGLYDFCVTTVGDNWSVSLPTGYGTLEVPQNGGVAVRLAAGVQEPSCGWIAWRRGPYVAGAPESQRGDWIVGQPENAGPFPRVSMPITTHHGGDYRRYQWNGWPWQQADYFQFDGLGGRFYRGQVAKGPLQLDGLTRPDLPNPPAFAPDLTLLSAVPNRPLYVATCWVDQFGRESPLSPKLLCPVNPGAGATFLELSRRFQPPHGAVAFRVYAGDRDTGPFWRQPVLDHTLAAKTYDWPLHLTRFYLHRLETNTPAPATSGLCRSWLSPVQQDLAAGKNVIDRPGKWRLTCPLLLLYDSNNFGRTIGGASRTALTAEFTASPAVIVYNQRDSLKNLDITTPSVAALASSDWSGGQAFSNFFEKCTFTSTAADGYGLLVDECASVWFGQHTMSEALFRNCIFTAARPLKLEGNQTAKCTFDDRCTFNCTGRTRFLSEVCALQLFTPNAVVFNGIEGVNGLNNYRTFCGLYSHAGPPTARIKNVFIDSGCSVLFAFGPNTGGTVELEEGDKIGIYGVHRNWFRLAECPNSLTSRLAIRGLSFPSTTSILSYNLNQLAIALDRPIAEVVTPSEADWTARGLFLNYGGKDWTLKQGTGYDYAVRGQADTLPRRAPALAAPVVP